MKNDADLLPRVRRDKMSRVKNDTDPLQRVRQDNKSRVKNDANLFAKSKMRQDE